MGTSSVIGDLDARNLPSADRAVVVVGAGAAGIACARELSRQGRRVLLIEGGGATTSVSAGGSEPPATGRFRLESGRRQGLGGTAEAWHGQCMRLHDDDLEARSWLEGSGWPVRPDALAEFFAAAEDMFELSGHSFGAERWAEHPRLTPPAWRPELLRHDFTEYAPHPYLGRRFQEDLAADPHIEVVLQATVAGIEVSGAGQVTALRLFDAAGRPGWLPAAEVVLAAGAIENARILQLSDPDGVGLGTGRWHTGRWLADHPVVRLGELRSADPRLQDLYTGLHHRGAHLFPKLRLSPDLQRAEGLLDAVAILSYELAPSALDAARRLRGGERSSAVELGAIARGGPALARAVWRRYVRGLSSGMRPEHVWLDSWLEQLPRSGSRVVLGVASDRFGLPQADVDWQVGELEMQTSRRLAAVVGTELKRLDLATLVPSPGMTDDDAWNDAVIDAYHPSGTTRMSADPAGGVVDADLAVHGVDGLWVVGGSVFPIAGYANPTLTIVALALRLARRLSRNRDDRPVRAGV